MAFSDYVAEELKLFWPAPIRAHPNVPLDFRFSYYEKDNRVLTWSITNNPTWMTLDQFGRVTGTPTTSTTHSAITVTVAREGGGSVQTTFDCVVGTSDFIFVATTGNNTTGTGSISAPYQTIAYAISQLAGGNGKTIYIRGGTYQEWWNNSAPIAGKSFTSNDYTEIRGYPSETAILDCMSSGHGIWLFQTTYAVISNLECKNANYPDRAGLLMSESSYCAIKDCIVHDCKWDYSTNPAGIYVAGVNSFADRCVAYNNGDDAAPNGNSSNFIIYTEGDTSSDYLWVMNCKSYGCSKYGYKIKHAGPKHLVLHNLESFDKYGAAPTSNYTSMRYCVFYNAGVRMQETEPSRSGGPVLVEHCTFANCGGSGERCALDIYDPYLVNNLGEYNYNIFYDSRSAAGTGEFDYRLVQHHIYTPTSTVLGRTLTTDWNLYYSPSSSNIFRMGNTGGSKDLSWAQWQALSRDTHGRFALPGFVNYGAGNLNVAESSNADFGGGLFAGAFAPGRTYGNVGQSNTTLLVWDGTGSSSGNPPAFADEKYLNIKTRKTLRRYFYS